MSHIYRKKSLEVHKQNFSLSEAQRNFFGLCTVNLRSLLQTTCTKHIYKTLLQDIRELPFQVQLLPRIWKEWSSLVLFHRVCKRDGAIFCMETSNPKSKTWREKNLKWKKKSFAENVMKMQLSESSDINFFTSLDASVTWEENTNGHAEKKLLAR